MKSKKVTMLAAALVVAVVALAGVGYAATTYRAETTNDNNSLQTTYLTVTQTAGASYSTPLFDKVYFDTKNTTNTTTINYTPVTTHTSSSSAYTKVNDRAGDCALISKSLTLSIVQTNGNAPSATMDVTVTNFAPVDGLKYTMILGSQSEGVITVAATADYDTTKDKWAFSSVPLNTDNTAKTLEVYLFISLVNSEAPVTVSTNIATAGFNVKSDASAETNDSVFTFTLEATAVSA